MITQIKIRGFKSFHHFETDFAPFTVIAGANAAGKSNLFDALNLLSALANKDLRAAFNEQRGAANELFTRYNNGESAKEMEFEVDMLLDRKIKDRWGGEEELNHVRLRYRLIIERKEGDIGIENFYVKHESLEKIRLAEDEWLKKYVPKEAMEYAKSQRSGGSPKPYISTELKGNVAVIKMRQDGRQGGKETPANVVSQTVLGSVNTVDFRHVLAVKTEMSNWRFLQFNPDDLREPTRKDTIVDYSMSKSGKNLAAALFRIQQKEAYLLRDISRRLQTFIPNFIRVAVEDDAANNQYIVKLTDRNQRVHTSRVLSEGTLRVLALCVMAEDERHTGLLCFEEPENGIHPFRMESMVHLVRDLSTDFSDGLPLRQIIVNTHSPLFVGKVLENYWNNPQMRIYLYKIISTTATVDEQKISIDATAIDELVLEDNGLFNDANLKNARSKIAQYLETANFEDLKSSRLYQNHK